MEPAVAIPQPKNRASNYLLAGTVVLSLVLLGWSLKGIDLTQLKEEVESLDWRWVSFAMVMDILVYACHGWRWHLLLRPITTISPWRCARAIYVGLYANEVLPFRTGEVIRCYLLARWTEQPFSVILSSALVERIFDGVWLLLCLVFALRYVALPRQWVDGGVLLAALIGIVAAVVAFAMFDPGRARSVFGRSRYTRWMQVVVDDLALIGHSRYLYFAWMASLPYLLLQVVPIYALAQAYGLEISMRDAMALMVILRLSAIVPQAPGNLGLFQLATIQGLLLFAVERGVAQRFALVLWGVVTLPLLLVGCLALAITGLKIRELQHEAQTTARERNRSGV